MFTDLVTTISHKGTENNVKSSQASHFNHLLFLSTKFSGCLEFAFFIIIPLLLPENPLSLIFLSICICRNAEFNGQKDQALGPGGFGLNP